MAERTFEIPSFIPEWRKEVTIDEIRQFAKESGVDNADELGVTALVEVEDMGFCSDGVTRWYVFDMDGSPCVYYKP